MVCLGLYGTHASSVPDCPRFGRDEHAAQTYRHAGEVPQRGQSYVRVNVHYFLVDELFSKRVDE